MKGKLLKTKTGMITVFAICAVSLIIAIQVYIVYNNYILTQEHFVREANSTLEETYRQELGNRYSRETKNDSTILKITRNPPKGVKADVVYHHDNQGDILGAMEKVLGDHMNRTYPIRLAEIDSLSSASLKSKGISSSLYVIKINTETDSILESSGNISASSFFTIKSKPFPISLKSNEALQIILKNPQAEIFQRLASLLILSLILSIICIYVLSSLKKTLTKQSKTIKYKNDFFDQIAHELRRPITGIQMALERLGTTNHTEKNSKLISIADTSVKSMSSTINIILALSKARESVLTLNYTEFNLIEAVEKIKNRYLEMPKKDIEISLKSASENILIKADEQHIIQSIENLMDNAIKYSEDNVEIIINIKKESGQVFVSVTDNGIGISPENLSNIFSKYTRESHKIDGFGIGLSYVETIVKAHKGKVSVESELGEGSTFTISLPL